MPNYDYQCNDCRHRFEVFQSMTEPKLDVCPRCGGKVARLIGPGAGMIFKGSGFYITDYRSDSYKKKEKSETGKKEKSETGTPKTKPAPETGAKKSPATTKGGGGATSGQGKGEKTQPTPKGPKPPAR